MADNEEHTYHPGRSEYIQIGIILTVLTGIEVVLFFVEPPQAVAIPALVLLTIVKFFLVALWFMHLRFDNRLFRWLFGVGGILAIAIYSIVIANFLTGPA
jgi:cytochrome c oxidase subunit 4